MGLAQDKFIERLAHYYCEINVLHPFRPVTAWRNAFSLSSWLSMRVIRWIGAILRSMRGTKANQSGAMGDLSPLQTIFRKVVSEAVETE